MELLEMLVPYTPFVCPYHHAIYTVCSWHILPYRTVSTPSATGMSTTTVINGTGFGGCDTNTRTVPDTGSSVKHLTVVEKVYGTAGTSIPAEMTAAPTSYMVSSVLIDIVMPVNIPGDVFWSLMFILNSGPIPCTVAVARNDTLTDATMGARLVSSALWRWCTYERHMI